MPLIHPRLRKFLEKSIHHVHVPIQGLLRLILYQEVVGELYLQMQPLQFLVVLPFEITAQKSFVDCYNSLLLVPILIS